MTPNDVLTYYRTKYNFCKQTKMNINSIRYWINRGYIPLASQYKLEAMTNGELKAALEHCKEFKKDNRGCNKMTIRSLLNVLECCVESTVTDAPDNFHNNKISFAYEDENSIVNEHLYFTEEEIKSLQRKLELVSSSIKAYLKE